MELGHVARISFPDRKKLIEQVQELAFYNPNRITSLQVDASRLHGLGFIRKQQQPASGIFSSRIPFLLIGRIQVHNDKAGMPRGRVGHEEM
jgi:hypothetical protein